MSVTDQIAALYRHHEVQPYISPDRDVEAWLLEGKPVPKRNMILLKDGLLAGDIILLWRIQFGTFTTKEGFPKYFEYTYGINAPEHLQKLVANGYVYQESAFDSLNHITSTMKKKILQAEGVTGLSKMKVADLDQSLAEVMTEDKLAAYFSVRGYALTEKGQAALAAYPEVVDRHPKKKL